MKNIIHTRSSISVDIRNVLYFFFYLYGAHRDLHSFPTRRSSDLFAAGRVGNTEDLALDEAAVDVDERGRIKVDSCYRTSAPGIYAAGDVIGPPALASVSMEQARVAACHAFGIPFKQAVDPIAPIGVYSIPEAAGVGLTEQQAATDGIDFEI